MADMDNVACQKVPQSRFNWDKERQVLWRQRKMGHDYAERTCAVEVVMSEEVTETGEHQNNRKDMGIN